MTSEVQTRHRRSMEPHVRYAHYKSSQPVPSRCKTEPADSASRPDPTEWTAAKEANEDEPGKQQHHVGSVMGIFFKVWSLVKVTKVRNQKIRRQNSEDASHFQYIAGDQLAGSSSHSRAAMLEDRHFRRAGSQPAASSSRPLEPLERGLDTLNNRLQVSGIQASAASRSATATGSTSSGVSSTTSSALANLTPPSTSGSAVRRQAASSGFRRSGVPVSGPECEQRAVKQADSSRASWSSNIRRSATTINPADSSCAPARYRNWRRPDEASKTGLAAQLQLQLQPAGEPASDEEDSNDIYSTPNDSIQSVPFGQSELAAQPAAQCQSQSQSQTGRLPPIVKSFSANNFGQLLKQQSFGQSSSRFKPIDELARQDSSGPARQPTGSRFFISSSSSEDSSSAGQQRRQPASQLQQLSIQQSVHCHTPSPSRRPLFRPDTLLLERPGSSLVTPVTLLTPASAAPLLVSAGGPLALGPMSPLDALPTLRALGSTAARVRPTSYRKSPSLFEIAGNGGLRLASRCLPARAQQLSADGTLQQQGEVQRPVMANSVSLNDCKLGSQLQQSSQANSEYKLAQMLLEFGSNPTARDATGCTALMHAVLSDNLAAVRCLVERGVQLDEINHTGYSSLDLLCSRPASTSRLEILKLLIERGADMDRPRADDGSRLLDRLISEHAPDGPNDKLPFIDCLLLSGAKLGSSTWLAAAGKHEVQLRLLRKLCQDGYFLYKKCSIEAAVYRFEYALKRIAELEQQLAGNSCGFLANMVAFDHATQAAATQLKYQTYLGLSRCERKRKFYKRALEFAHLAILVDSTAYEAFYSKAHILKDLGELDDSLVAIAQTSRLVEQSIESIGVQLRELDRQQEEAHVFDGCFDLLDSRAVNWFELARLELQANLEYLTGAKKHIAVLRAQTMADKLGIGADNKQTALSNDLIAT